MLAHPVSIMVRVERQRGFGELVFWFSHSENREPYLPPRVVAKITFWAQPMKMPQDISLTHTYSMVT